MTLIEILLIAFGLSMDALAVAVAGGAAMKKLKIYNALKMGLFFGIFQALMPVVGWFAGTGMKSFISSFDHWIAFALLLFVGGKMLYESFRMEEDEAKGDVFATASLFALSIATSIDALAVGVTFSFLDVSIIAPVLIIGLVTFLITAAGVLFGFRAGHFFENKMEAFGGIILILIGLKILLEHLRII